MHQTRTFEYGEDVAEFAALADDEWLALTLQGRERSAGDAVGDASSPGIPRRARSPGYSSSVSTL